jgi:hypothetical protein
VLSRIAVCSFRRESGTCTPPFFRTSTGHRVEGRNPWHLQCSHNQLPVGTQFRRLVRSLSLRPSWLLASWADQTEQTLSLPKASTSGLPALKSPQGLPDITTAPNGELRRQDFHLPVQQLVSLRSLLWVPVGSVSGLQSRLPSLRGGPSPGALAPRPPRPAAPDGGHAPGVPERCGGDGVWLWPVFSHIVAWKTWCIPSVYMGLVRRQSAQAHATKALPARLAE